MSQIRVDLRARPWAPTWDAKVVVEFDRHDVPLAGIVEQGGERYLFACLVGEMDDNSVWAFVPVSLEDEDRIGDLRGDDVDEAIIDRFRHTMITMIGAIDNQVMFSDLIDPGQESPAVWIDRFLGRWERELQRQQAAVGELVTA